MTPFFGVGAIDQPPYPQNYPGRRVDRGGGCQVWVSSGIYGLRLTIRGRKPAKGLTGKATANRFFSGRRRNHLYTVRFPNYGRPNSGKLFNMNGLSAHNRAESQGSVQNRCLSCGTTENIGKKKYCSNRCRQRLRQKLNIRTGLLKALNTRYATFYFTRKLILMDVLPYDSRDLYSFIIKRSEGLAPADDFSRLADLLGNAWWEEKNRTARNYLASRYVLSRASRNCSSTRSVNPIQVKIPVVNGNSLLHLKLNRSALASVDLEKMIKSAYRREAKKHHPDLGGNAASFRKVQQAYEDLIKWSENPTFLRRRRFPDKWFYDGGKNTWIQPAPCS